MLISGTLETRIKEQVQEFHQKKLDSIINLNLLKVLKKKNPYLFAAKGLRTPYQLVDAMLSAQQSSQEETHFGKFFESLAEYAILNYLHGTKKPFKGIGFEFERHGKIYLIDVKSGTEWGNSRSYKKLDDQFAKAIADIRRERGSSLEIECINGCSYGDDERKFENYRKMSGQAFWELLTDDAKFYLRIVTTIVEQSRLFAKLYHLQLVNTRGRLVKQFTEQFSTETGEVDWNKLVEFVSSK